MKAYDYDAQQWVEGEPARQLLIEQARQTLSILDGPSAAEYVAFIRKPGESLTVAGLRASVIRDLRAVDAPSAEEYVAFIIGQLGL